MEKKTKNYRLSEDTIREIQEISNMLNITETEVVTRSVHLYYKSLKKEDENLLTGAIVPFSQYQEIQNKLEQVVYKLGELQGEAKEKERIIEIKEEMIQFLKERINELEKKNLNKKWWQFWKQM